MREDALFTLLFILISQPIPQDKIKEPQQIPCAESYNKTPHFNSDAPIVCGPTRPLKKPIIKRPIKKHPDAYQKK